MHGVVFLEFLLVNIYKPRVNFMGHRQTVQSESDQVLQCLLTDFPFI